MLSKRWAHGCVYFAGMVYMISGYDGGHPKKCERFDFDIEEWEALPEIPIPGRCISTIGLAANSCIYVIGGYGDAAPLNCIQEFNIDLKRWIVLDVKLAQTGYSIPCFQLDYDSTDIYSY
mmetsp:Transcript_7395/g.13790  ORF Transcript_7395/g.13790 Transcript_7395/m.13790 type:complete len:120 (-) Transcript_7395:204-563(-)